MSEWREEAPVLRNRRPPFASFARFRVFRGPKGPASLPVYLALITAAFLWGSLYPAAKPAVAATGPMQVTFCRVGLAFLCLGTLVVIRNGPGLLRKQLRTHWRGILVLAALSFVGSQVLAMVATGLLPASVNGLLNNTHPLWVAIGSALFFPPRRPGLLVAGSVVALAGVALVFLPDLATGAQAGGATISPLGIALSLGGSGVIALSTAVGRRVMPGSDPLAVTTLASGAAILPMGLLTLDTGGFGLILAAPVDVKLLLLYLGIGCTAVNFGLWYYGLKHLSAARASAFQYLIPPTSVVIAVIFLGEPLTASLALGALFILTGLVVTQIASTGGSSGRSSREGEAGRRAPSPGLPLAH